MAVTSVMLRLGIPAPPFALRDVVSGQVYSLDSFAGKPALLVIFLCRHRLYVQHVQYEIAKIGQDYRDTGLRIIAISSNDPAQYADDAPEWLKEMAQQLNLRFPLCFDQTQDAARYSRPPVRRTSISFSLTNPDGWSIEGSSMIADRAMVAR